MTKLNALFIGNSYMNRQEAIIPALLAPLHYDFAVRTVYAPGQTFLGHLQNNAGIITEQQKEGVERGRIGGWFSPAHCETLYAIARSNQGYLDRALAAMKYDVAFILVSGSDCAEPEAEQSLANGKQLIDSVRERNPGITIVLFYPWTYLGRPEELPQFEWLGQRLALENQCLLAPVGAAFRHAEEQLPDCYLRRSRKDSHQNDQSILLVAYTQICAFLGPQAMDLDFSVNRANPASLRAIEGVAASLDENTDRIFLKIARETTRQAAADLRALTVATLQRPVIQKPDTGITVFHADKRILVIGNSWFDAHGAVWAELINSYKDREEIGVHVETLTDDAATFQSILANNKGEPTPRQRRIIELTGKMQASMGIEKPDADALDGFVDCPIATILTRLADRKAKLDQTLALNVPWDAVILQGFRGALEPDEDDFLACGKELIGKVRHAVGNAPLFLMQHWAKKGAPAGSQDRINAAYRQLASEVNLPVIPIGEAVAATRDVELLCALYTPNVLGTQLIAETIRQHIHLV